MAMPGRPKPGGDRGTQTGVSCSNSEEQGAWLIGQRKPVTTEKLPPLPPAHCRRLELGSIRGRATVRATVRVIVRMKGRTRGWAEGRNMVKATERVKVMTTVKAVRQGKLGKGEWPHSSCAAGPVVRHPLHHLLSHLPPELFLPEKSQLQLRYKKLVRADVSAPWLSPWGPHTLWVPYPMGPEGPSRDPAIRAHLHVYTCLTSVASC